jgi:hypothetical protein
MTIVIGDSLAVGFGAAAHIETHARVSASSCAIASFAPSGSADVIVVSAGSTTRRAGVWTASEHGCTPVG